RGSQMQRAIEKADLQEANSSIQFYVPQENKEINDKATANPEGLAERIVRHDTDAILWSDTVVIEPLPEALGTHVELGQLKGMKDVATILKSILDESESVDGTSRTEFITTQVRRLTNDILGKRIYPHYEDIRRVPGIVESDDRRSLGINQYVYGVCLDLTDGKGFYDWEEIKEELK
ncbi:UNVERIFIED_CONTAM: hypothetical protein RF648_21680, partial [Kocuria sp. CPCC 205274]